MKKIFIGLLIAAAGAGVYYFLQNRKPAETNSIQKELLAGKWKPDTLSVHPGDSLTGFMTGLAGMIDSNLLKYQYEIRNDGLILQSIHDTVITDTSYYEWSKENELSIKDSKTDSTGEVFTVSKLSADSLLVHSKDSVSFLLTKLK
jgi:hypothetical protein